MFLNLNLAVMKLICFSNKVKGKVTFLLLAHHFNKEPNQAIEKTKCQKGNRFACFHRFREWQTNENQQEKIQGHGV